MLDILPPGAVLRYGSIAMLVLGMLGLFYIASMLRQRRSKAWTPYVTSVVPILIGALGLVSEVDPALEPIGLVLGHHPFTLILVVVFVWLVGLFIAYTDPQKKSKDLAR